MGHLTGIRVLDFSRVMAGPYCTALLGDLGAEVIKIETPSAGDDSRRLGPFVNGHSVYFALLNRNKKSITLDLKSPRAQAIMLTLAKSADVVVENFRPGVVRKLGIDYERLSAANPRLVYLSLSGFGQTGPFVDRPAYDLIIQAMSGLMSVTGTPEGDPTAAGDSIADATSGLMGSWAILAALQGRTTSGRGDYIDLAMFDTLRGLQLTRLAQLAAFGTAPVRVGNRHPVTVPCDTFRTRDGAFALVVPSDAQFAVLAQLMDRADLLADARFSTYAARTQHESELKALIALWCIQFDTDPLVERCLAAGLSAGPVWDHAQAARSTQSIARGATRTTEHPAFGSFSFVTQPAQFRSDSSAQVVPEPALGADTDAVLRDLAGLSLTDIAALRSNKVI
jgi:CoA:oxalate CoA-transferase